MDSQTIISSLIAGFIIYVLIELDKKYFTKEESKHYSSLRIAATISLIVYVVITYFKCSYCTSPAPSASTPNSLNQQILNEPF